MVVDTLSYRSNEIADIECRVLFMYTPLDGKKPIPMFLRIIDPGDEALITRPDVFPILITAAPAGRKDVKKCRIDF
jgi:hypothetical protein